MLHSVPSFATLFRHALMALGVDAPAERREAVQALAERLGFDATAILQALDVREKKAEPKKLNVENLCAGYLAAIEQVAAAVDKALDREASSK